MGFFQGGAHKGHLRNGTGNGLFLHLEGEYSVSTSLLLFRMFIYVLNTLLFCVENFTAPPPKK